MRPCMLTQRQVLRKPGTTTWLQHWHADQLHVRLEQQQVVPQAQMQSVVALFKQYLHSHMTQTVPVHRLFQHWPLPRGRMWAVFVPRGVRSDLESLDAPHHVAVELLKIKLAPTHHPHWQLMPAPNCSGPPRDLLPRDSTVQRLL